MQTVCLIRPVYPRFEVRADGLSVRVKGVSLLMIPPRHWKGGVGNCYPLGRGKSGVAKYHPIRQGERVRGYSKSRLLGRHEIGYTETHTPCGCLIGGDRVLLFVAPLRLSDALPLSCLLSPSAPLNVYGRITYGIKVKDSMSDNVYFRTLAAGVGVAVSSALPLV